MLGGSFGFHHTDLLDFTLEDEETIVVQVNALALEEICDFFEVGLFVVNVVVAGVVSVGCTGDGQI